MASKALKVIGIGCGALVLLGIIGVSAGAYWVKGKVQGMGEWAQQMEAQSKELTALEQKYPFEAPPEGEALKLSSEQVEKYLAIRRGLSPAFEKFEEDSKKFKKKDGEEASMSEGISALGALGDMSLEFRASFVEQLKAQRLGPSEYHAISQAILAGGFEEGGQNAQLLAPHKEEIEKHAQQAGFDALLATSGSP